MARAVFEGPERLIDRLAAITEWATMESIRRGVVRPVEGSALYRICSSVSPIRNGILHRLRKIWRCRSCIRSHLVWSRFIGVIDECVGERIRTVLELIGGPTTFWRAQAPDFIGQDL